MRFPDQTTAVRPSGLRYASKVNGSIFSPDARTMSCILCGNHRPRSALKTLRLAGAINYRCEEGCGPTASAS